MEHGLKGVILTSDEGRPLSVCLCLAVAGGKHENRWKHIKNADGTHTYTPSFAWPGHFHVFATNVPAIDWSDKFHADDSTDGK